MLGYNYNDCPRLISVCLNALMLVRNCTEWGESWVAMLTPVHPHPHAAFWGRALINVFWWFCLENHLLTPHAVFIHAVAFFFFCHFAPPGCYPFHATIYFCSRSQLTPGRVVVPHSQWTHQYQLWHRRRDAPEGSTVLSHGRSEKGG